MNVLDNEADKEARKRGDMNDPAKKHRKNLGKSFPIQPAKFCARERGGICPGNCNICVQRYLFGQIPY